MRRTVLRITIVLGIIYLVLLLTVPASGDEFDEIAKQLERQTQILKQLGKSDADKLVPLPRRTNSLAQRPPQRLVRPNLPSSNGETREVNCGVPRLLPSRQSYPQQRYSQPVQTTVTVNYQKVVEHLKADQSFMRQVTPQPQQPKFTQEQLATVVNLIVANLKSDTEFIAACKGEGGDDGASITGIRIDANGSVFATIGNDKEKQVGKLPVATQPKPDVPAKEPTEAAPEIYYSIEKVPPKKEK